MIKKIIEQYKTSGRTKISQIVRSELNWYETNGHLKDMAPCEALRRMEKKGLITLLLKSGKRDVKQLTHKEVNFKKTLYSIEGNIKKLGVTG